MHAYWHWYETVVGWASGIESENFISDTIKRVYCLLVWVLPLPREAFFTGQNCDSGCACIQNDGVPEESGQYLTSLLGESGQYLMIGWRRWFRKTAKEVCTKRKREMLVRMRRLLGLFIANLVIYWLTFSCALNFILLQVIMDLLVNMSYRKVLLGINGQIFGMDRLSLTQNLELKSNCTASACLSLYNLLS